MAKTFKDAAKYNKDITYEDVKAWKASQDFGQKAKMRGMNSFVASKPKEEYQVDLFFMADQPVDNKLKNGLLMVDIFTKYTQVVLLKSKQIPDVLDAIKRCLVKMGGKPETFYMDEEGAVQSKVIQKYFKDEDIRMITTNSHAPVAERQIRTIKSMIYKRIEHNKLEWWEVLDQVLDTYNKSEHTVTQVSPINAMKPGNHSTVKLNMELRRSNTRKYPDIETDDLVRIFKKKEKLDKERVSNWSKNKYKVIAVETSMNQKFYKLEGYTNLVIRAELLLVS